MPVETLTQLIRVNTTLLHRYSQVVYNHRPAGCLLTNPVGGRIGLRATEVRGSRKIRPAHVHARICWAMETPDDGMRIQVGRSTLGP